MDVDRAIDRDTEGDINGDANGDVGGDIDGLHLLRFHLLEQVGAPILETCRLHPPDLRTQAARGWLHQSAEQHAAQVWASAQPSGVAGIAAAEDRVS